MVQIILYFIMEHTARYFIYCNRSDEKQFAMFHKLYERERGRDIEREKKKGRERERIK